MKGTLPSNGGKALFTFFPKIGPSGPPAPSQQAKVEVNKSTASFSTTFPKSQLPSASDCPVFWPPVIRTLPSIVFWFFYNHLDWLCLVNSKTTTALSIISFINFLQKILKQHVQKDLMLSMDRNDKIETPSCIFFCHLIFVSLATPPSEALLLGSSICVAWNTSLVYPLHYDPFRDNCLRCID